MTSSMLAMTVSLILGLPIFALGERIRERGERRPSRPHNASTRKDIS